MLRLKGGRLYDPARAIDGQVGDLYLEGGRIVAPPGPDGVIDGEIDVTGRVVMAGAIDLHTHIGGGKMNIARMLLPEDHRGDPVPARDLHGGGHLHGGCGHAAPATWTTGYRYAEMGYTACFEPAMLPANARHAHLEMGDIPMVDKGAYAMLGNDDFFLRLLSSGADQRLINDYVGWTLDATQAMAIKVVNPGGISAFKFNARNLDLDEAHPHYGVTPRQVIQALARAVHDLGVAHPLHVHASNLGIPGNADTTLATMAAAEGLPIHLTHIQFHSYGTEGARRFSSEAERIAAAINRMANVSADVGQILFGQTVTASGDTMGQHRNHRHASPDKWVVMDIECDAGCGVVPFRYRDKNFVNALQWAIGLELFLRVADPWRLFLTTDHPNGAPFTSYPHLIRLLMDRDFRNGKLDEIHAEAAAHSQLRSLAREYSLYEIAIMTRAGPARSLGLADRGHLGPGAWADVVVYRDEADREAMFAKPEYVFKDGELIVRDGRVVKVVNGALHALKPEYDKAIEQPLREYFDRYMTVKMEHMKIGDDEICACGASKLIPHKCGRLA
ncbi:MAG: formylmethanofuran dehydrogenase subunit A [Pseudomonadota bacterium]